MSAEELGFGDVVTRVLGLDDTYTLDVILAIKEDDLALQACVLEYKREDISDLEKSVYHLILTKVFRDLVEALGDGRAMVQGFRDCLKGAQEEEDEEEESIRISSLEDFLDSLRKA